MIVSGLTVASAGFGVVLSVTGAAQELPVESTPLSSALFLIDTALFGVGLAVAFVMVIWFASRREDPLRLAPPRPNRFREDSVALAVVVYLSAAMVLSLVMEALDFSDEDVVTSIVVGSGAQIAGAVACLVLASRQFVGGVRRLIGGPAIGPPRRGLSLSAVLAVAGIGVCPAVGALTLWGIMHFLPDYQAAGHPTLVALEHPQPVGTVVALWVGALVVAPIAEELFFRGLLQTAMVLWLRSRWWAIAVSSLAFGVVHITQPHAVLALVLLGLLMGYAFERTGSLLPAILIHMAFNGKTLVWEALLRSP